MTYEEFADWTYALAEEERLTPDQAEDLRRQRALFDEQREMIEAEYAGAVAGFVDDDLVVTRGVSLILNEALERFGGERQLYFEPLPARPGEEL
jgi:hypothetical protein